MLASILKHEWRNLMAERVVWAVGGLFALLVAYGLINGTGWVQFQRQTLAQAQQEEITRLDKLQSAIADIESGKVRFTGDAFADPRQPRTVGNNKGTRYATLPPGPLAPLAVGQSDLYPYYFKVSTLNKQTFIQNNELENPTNLLAGRFDLAFVIIYLLPLCILALGYNLLSGERDEGTLALLLSQPVGLPMLVLGKVLVRGGMVIALAAVLSLAGAVLGGADLGDPGVRVRLGLWVLVVILYGVFWFALAVAVNAAGGRTPTNAVVLVGLWLLFVVIVPAVVNVAVSTASPVPSRVELIQAIREATNAANAQGSRLLARYYEDHPELAPKDSRIDPGSFALRSTAVRETVDKAIAPVLERYDRQLLAQQALVERYRYLSPAIVAQEAFNDLAGTGLGRYRHFQAQVDRYHRTWQAYFVPRIFRQQTVAAAEIGRLPKFRFAEESTDDVAGRVLPGLVGLAAPLLVLVGLTLPGLRRYPVAA
ncbi:ABC transporter permease [Gloeobacter morelensis]|uniref:DUF3526 domain-containing protein n=1 Tax=Gloeobacter morelensis MG652769 TaxID=2781736 RepID=A0ABY3PQU1_9CYAN|nr:DUF3526 domain-containing protein [Gloeobacter morelensis]UFP96053.1 DUF3526 domain-containing protein [Gloeobacter morelensis MG652769]